MRFATAGRCRWPCFLTSVLLPLSDLLPPPAAGSKAPKSLNSGANDKIRTCGLLPARPDRALQAHARRRGSAVGASWSKSFREQGSSILRACRSKGGREGYASRKHLFLSRFDDVEIALTRGQKSLHFAQGQGVLPRKNEGRKSHQADRRCRLPRPVRQSPPGSGYPKSSQKGRSRVWTSRA